MTLSKKDGLELAETVAKNIRSRREALGMTRLEFANAAKLSLSALQRIEKATRWPSAECAERIAKVLKVKAWWLYVPGERE